MSVGTLNVDTQEEEEFPWWEHFGEKSQWIIWAHEEEFDSPDEWMWYGYQLVRWHDIERLEEEGDHKRAERRRAVFDHLMSTQQVGIDDMTVWYDALEYLDL